MTPPQRFLCRRLRDKGFEEGVKKGVKFAPRGLGEGVSIFECNRPRFCTAVSPSLLLFGLDADRRLFAWRGSQDLPRFH